MFDAVRNNKRIVQVFLALITLPFAFFGVDSYVRSVGAGSDVATIGDFKVTQQQFQQAMREKEDRLRAQQVDPKLLDTPAGRQAVVDELVNRQLLLLEANKRRMVVGDDEIRKAIGSIEAFIVDGKFSSERYEAALRGQGLSPAGFEAQLRQDLTIEKLAGALVQSGLTAHTVSDRLIALQGEKRDVMEYRFLADKYLDKVKLADDAAKKYYDENSKQFELPEQAKAEYVVLSMDAIADRLEVTDAEVKAWYDDENHKKLFLLPEERRASHILIGSEKIGKEKAKAKAEALLAEIRKTPARFADLAKKNSDDPGSAIKGGDLGFFGRGMMVKPFEETAFTLKEGEISGMVESDYGFHIIKLTGIHAARKKPLAEAKGEIVAELKKTAASRKFAEAAENFSNMVYEQPDSLAPVAEKFGLEIKKSDWLGRAANPANGVLGNEKLMLALFSEDSLKSKRNTAAVDIGTNTLAAARLVDYKPAAMQAFDDVKANIEALLKKQEAQAAAKKDGEARLEALRKGEDKMNWGVVKSISRMDPRLIPSLAVPVVFRMDASKLPAYAGVELPGSGFALFKLVKVSEGEQVSEANRLAMLNQLGSLAAQEDLQIYLAALRSRYKVEINQAAMANKE